MDVPSIFILCAFDYYDVLYAEFTANEDRDVIILLYDFGSGIYSESLFYRCANNEDFASVFLSMSFYDLL